MSKFWAFIGIATAVGTGYILGKKLMEQNPETVTQVKENCTEKFRKASEYCADAVKTSGEKISEIVQTGKTKSSDIAKMAKNTTTSFKDELNNLKSKIVSAGKSAEVDFYDEDEDDASGFTADPENEFIEEEQLEEPEAGSEAL